MGGKLRDLYARGGGPRPRVTGASAGPLRKIVEEGVNEHGVHTETLECGHTIFRKKDLFGYTNAVRRRCRKCGQSSHENP